jgi:hypothetical protein
VTNFGARAILALDRKRRTKVLSPDEADLRLLLALETFSVDGNGRRSVGMKLLAESAGVPYATARRARDRLIAEGVISCEAGSGRGNLTTWRFLIPLKVPSQSEHLSETERCSPAPDMSPDASEKVLTSSGKGAHQNPSASDNANTGLETSGNKDDARAAAVAAVAGKYAWPLDHAQRVVTAVIARAKKPVTKPERYVMSSIQREPGTWAPDAARWRPDTGGSTKSARQNLARCRVCRQKLDPAVAAEGIHPNCLSDDPPSVFTRNPAPPDTARRGAAEARALLDRRTS